MEAVRNHQGHEDEIDHADWHEVFPLERENLVDSQTREGPAQPHQKEHDEEGLADEPYGAGDVVHHHVESLEACNVQRCPTAQEDGGGHTSTDEEVEVFCQIIIAEVHTGIFRVVAGSQLTLTLREVKLQRGR